MPPGSSKRRNALTGADPRRAEEPQPCPSWRADATAAVRALLAGRFAEVHARLAAQGRAKVSVPQLEC